MKKIQLNKKLQLNKETVANLNANQMNVIRGGDIVKTTKAGNSNCATACEATCPTWTCADITCVYFSCVRCYQQ